MSVGTRQSFSRSRKKKFVFRNCHKSLFHNVDHFSEFFSTKADIFFHRWIHHGSQPCRQKRSWPCLTLDACSRMNIVASSDRRFYEQLIQQDHTLLMLRPHFVSSEFITLIIDHETFVAILLVQEHNEGNRVKKEQKLFGPLQSYCSVVSWENRTEKLIFCPVSVFFVPSSDLMSCKRF